MLETGAPEVLWDYCIEWCAQVRSHTALNINGLNGQVPATTMTGDTSDISFLAEFSWYEWVWYISPQGTLDKSLHVKRLGRYLGPATAVGDALCGLVMTEKATVLERTSIIPLTAQDNNEDGTIKLKQVFEDTLKLKLNDRMEGIKAGKDPADLDDDQPIEPVVRDQFLDYVIFDSDQGDADHPPLPQLQDTDDYDINKYVAARVKIPRDGFTFANGKVARRAKDSDTGELIGTTHSNPWLDTSVYEVEFEDGAVERYNANIIAEHIYAQLDDQGNTVNMLDEIIDHRADNTAVSKEDAFHVSPNGRKSRKKTTKGWSLCIR